MLSVRTSFATRNLEYFTADPNAEQADFPDIACNTNLAFGLATYSVLLTYHSTADPNAAQAGYFDIAFHTGLAFGFATHGLEYFSADPRAGFFDSSFGNDLAFGFATCGLEE